MKIFSFSFFMCTCELYKRPVAFFFFFFLSVLLENKMQQSNNRNTSRAQVCFVKITLCGPHLRGLKRSQDVYT